MPNWVSNPSAVLPIRAGHDAGVGDDEIERLAGVDQRVGADAHAVQRRKIQLDQLKSAAVLGGRAHARGRRFGLGQIARGADDFRAVRDERARRLHAETGRHAGHQHALAFQVYALEHFVGGGCRAEDFWRDSLFHGRHTNSPRCWVAQRPALGNERRKARGALAQAKRSPTICSLFAHRAWARSGLSA